VLPERVSILAAAFLQISETSRLHYQPDWSSVFPGESLNWQTVSCYKSARFPWFQRRGTPTYSCRGFGPFHVGI